MVVAVAFASARPRIMVNIVVCGLNQEQLTRYEKNFGKEGFMRLRSGGAEFLECYAEYAPTTSEAGLATFATGTLPALHGISSSKVYDRTSNKFVALCHKQELKQTETINKQVENCYTTRPFLVQTLSESVRQSFKNSRTITIAHKPLSAMILAGDSGECYWINGSGKWTSADCYMTDLPTWVHRCNSDDINYVYATDTWYGKYLRERYVNTHSTDIAVYDKSSARRQRSRKSASDDWVEKMLSMPSGNLAIFEFAKRAVTSIMPLKLEDDTKMLTICLDVPRIVAEKYGPDSIEYEDMLYSLDTTLGEFLTFLYAQLSKPDEAVVVLTSDGGVSPSERNNSDAARFNTRQFEIIINAFLSARYGQDTWISGYQDGSLYLNHDVVYNHKKSLAEVQNEIASFALQYRGVSMTSTATAMRSAQFSSGLMALIQNGYSHRYSGDVVVALAPGRIESDSRRVAMSGSAYSYDRHIPLLIYGGGVVPQRISDRVSSEQIASTLADLIGANRPQCADVQPLKIEKK